MFFEVLFRDNGDDVNFDTYSVEFLKTQQALCSEIDTIGNVMASMTDSLHKPDNKNNNILKWWYIIQDKSLGDRRKKDIKM